MIAVRAADTAEFERALGPLLASDELRHTVPMGILSTTRSDPGRYPEMILWLAEDDGDGRAGLMRTPPFPAVVFGDPAAMDALAAAVHAAAVQIPGVTGVDDVPAAFADAWVAYAGGRHTVHMRTRLHALRALEPVPDAPGRMRPAESADRDLLLLWQDAFRIEAGIHASPRDMERSLDDSISRELGAFVWEHREGPVSFSLSRPTSERCARVGPVYTPPEHRRRGYATALVGRQTEALLTGTTTTCVLFTDLANPTSNAIYRRIGYQPVCDAVEIAFEPA